jgi:hypothetical protein
MKTHNHSLSLFTAIFCLAIASGCKKESGYDTWIESKEISIIADKSTPENGKQYLEVIYENVGSDTVRKIKYQLITRTGVKTDTVEKTIIPETVFPPRAKHLVPKPIGELPATWDEVHIGKIWVVKDKM